MYYLSMTASTLPVAASGTHWQAGSGSDSVSSEFESANELELKLEVQIEVATGSHGPPVRGEIEHSHGTASGTVTAILRPRAGPGPAASASARKTWNALPVSHTVSPPVVHESPESEPPSQAASDAGACQCQLASESPLREGHITVTASGTVTAVTRSASASDTGVTPVAVLSLPVPA